MDIYQQAIDKFTQAWTDAKQQHYTDAAITAMATTSADGQPSIRMMTLKGISDHGFEFFTNTNSRKGRELAENPKAAILFYWHELNIQIKVEGYVEAMPESVSDSHWKLRNRNQQIAAWASRQSEILESRELLRERYREMHDRFVDETIERPESWFGFYLKPTRFEFWEAGWDKNIHEGNCYEKSGDGWKHYLLYP